MIAGSSIAESGTYAVPVPVPSEIYSLAQSGGGDICAAAASNGTGQLNCALVYFGTSTAEIWVSVTLTAGVSTTIYLFYKSNSGTLSQPSASGTYGSQAVYTAVGNMTAVLHDCLTDSTSNANNGTNHGSASNSSGKFAGTSATFTGSTPTYISLPALLTGPNASVSFWVNPTSIGTSDSQPGLIGSTDTQGSMIALKGAAGYAEWYHSGWHAASTNAVSTAAWTRIDLTNASSLSTSGNVTLYVNGQQVAQASETYVFLSGYNIYLGARGDIISGAYALTGYMDEVQFSSVIRSANRIATDYNLQTGVGVTVGTPAATNWRNAGAIRRRRLICSGGAA